ncbi:MAG: hypothetical protein H0U01_03240, partial [Acidimicrobiia bacterium]|nr:hypothetical protein [Acidimicrobiia bacterium]
MDLSGPWRAHLADDEIRRAGIELATDDAAWVDAPVPGHWRDHPAFADSDGPVLYRRRFEMPEPAEGRR